MSSASIRSELDASSDYRVGNLSVSLFRVGRLLQGTFSNLLIEFQNQGGTVTWDDRTQDFWNTYYHNLYFEGEAWLLRGLMRQIDRLSL